MADKEGRGGFGWFIIGLLIGVAGTLATQRLVLSGGQVSRSSQAAVTPTLSPSASGPAAVSAAAGSARPKLTMHEGGLSGAPHMSAAAIATDQSPADVADDAAAAGMTSRAGPSQHPTN